MTRESSGRIILAWAAVAAWAALIFALSATPSLSSGLGTWDYVLRKGAHMFEFGVLAFLIWWALRQHGVGRAAALAAGAAAALVYAMTDEYHQSFVEGRAGTVTDVGFDLVGIFVAAVLIIVVTRRSHTPEPPS